MILPPFCSFTFEAFDQMMCVCPEFSCEHQGESYLHVHLQRLSVPQCVCPLLKQLIYVLVVLLMLFALEKTGNMEAPVEVSDGTVESNGSIIEWMPDEVKTLLGMITFGLFISYGLVVKRFESFDGVSVFLLPYCSSITYHLWCGQCP